MRLKIHWLLAGLVLLLTACMRTPEPGIYRARTETGTAFLRVSADSLGNEEAVLYNNTGGLWAEADPVDLKSSKFSLDSYVAPEFQHYPPRDVYKEPVYKVWETRDIVYGRAMQNEKSDDVGRNLTMDLYQPMNDGASFRPLMVMFHGGGFKNGNKRDYRLTQWCKYFASLGYVVSSVDYRQGFRSTFQESDDVLYLALMDANAAVRFLLKRDSLQIHPGRIFAAGMDAGAITALNLAYIRDKNLPEIIGDDADSLRVLRQSSLRGFDVRAVANLWGAVPDTAILHNARIPVISFQSKGDAVIPFGAGYPFEELEESKKGLLQSAWESLQSLFLPDRHPFRKVYGAGVIHRILSSRGVRSELHAYNGKRHNLFLLSNGKADLNLYDEIKEQTAAFFSSEMVVSPVSLHQDPEDRQLFVIDKSDVTGYCWNVEGGVILGSGEGSVRVLMFPDAPVHSVSVSGVYSFGQTFDETVVVDLPDHL